MKNYRDYKPIEPKKMDDDGKAACYASAFLGLLAGIIGTVIVLDVLGKLCGV